MQVKDSTLQKWIPNIDVDQVYDVVEIQWTGCGVHLHLCPDDIKPENRSTKQLAVCWDNVICYQVTHESFRPDCWISNPEDAWSFFVSSTSEYLASARENNPTLPHSLFHFEIVGTNIIVDVLSENYPEITFDTDRINSHLME